MKYYWCKKFDDSWQEVTQEEATRLESQGEFVTTSLASAVFYLCN